MTPTATFVYVLLAVVWIPPGQADGQAQPPGSSPDIIYGTVVNAFTHAPIGRALVSSSDDRFATLTDGDGHFEFKVPKAEGRNNEVVPIQGSHSGVSNSGIQVSLEARKPGFLNDHNESGPIPAFPGRELTISLIPEALIKGRVTLSNDAAMGMNVQIFARVVQDGAPRWVPGASMRTNSNGEFRFAELQPGAYKLMTHEWMDNDPASTIPGGQLYGAPPVYYSGAADFAAAAMIQLFAGQTVDANVSVVRQPYYPVSIPVANAESNTGISVAVSVQGHRGPGYSLGYNSGKQRIEGSLPNGSYTVEAFTYGPNGATGVVNLVVAGAPVEGSNMVLTRNGSVTVNVREEFTSSWDGSGSWSDGKHNYSLHGPRLYLNLRAESAEDFGGRASGSLRQPLGPNDESLLIEDLAAGRYWLRVNSSRGYVASATMGSIDLLHQPFEVEGSSEPIEIKMRDDNAAIEGTVAGNETTNDAAASAPQVYIYCVPLPDSPGQFMQLLSSADGTFDYPMMAPGTYRVLAFKSRQPNLPYRDAEGMRAFETKGQIVHLSAGQKATVQVHVISTE
jgi:hypothetical protein